jgi:hypothetical protein
MAAPENGKAKKEARSDLFESCGCERAIQSGAKSPHSKTLARHVKRSDIRQVLECGGWPALWIRLT